jgi:hypothetical protein
MRVSHRFGRRGYALVVGLLIAVLLAPAAASAHERRDLLNGRYQAVVGFLNEPAYDGQLNGLSLAVTDKTQKTPDGKDKPVEGLEKTLKAQVLAQGKTMDLTLRSRFGMPGNYAAYFEPTVAGQYIFRVYGQIEGQQIDERFESGPGRFNDVESLAPLQFPAKVGTAPADLQAQLDSAQSRANTALTVGIAGIVLGVLGLAVAALTLARRRPDATTAPAAPAGTAATRGD